VWFRVNAWRRLAETCNQYLSKGRLVMVEGELAEPKPYQSRDGEWRASLDITARQVKFLGGRSDSGGAPATSQPGAPAGPSDVGGGGSMGEEEIPF